jgi:transposase
MTETVDITTEQINDLPLVLGIIEDRGIRRMIDARMTPHGGWQGISVGTVVSIWLCHLLMERDHHLVSVRDWAAARTHTLNALWGLTLRETALTDDRLANVLTMLSDAVDQAAVDHALLTDWIQVYALPITTVRLDSTSVSVYHDDPAPDGLLRLGHSKDHRPDLAQFKAMLASLDPLGLPVALQVVPGKQADDGLYIPAYDAAVRTLGRADVLVVGDSKMGARATRAHIAATQSAYLCAYRPAGATATDQIAGWIEDALAHSTRWQGLRTVDERTGEITTRAVIDAWERDQQDGDTAWTERVLVVRSTQMQAGLRRTRETALTRATEHLALLQRPPGRGRRVYRSRAALQQAVTAILTAARLDGIVRVDLAAETRRDGSPRWTVGSIAVDVAAWQALVDRLGWHVYVTNTTADQYTAPALVDAYRHQVIQERGFARLKTRNLHIRPIYLSDERRIAGLTWLLCLALRVLTLTAYRLRTALQQRGETLAGLNPASRAQTTRRPTTERVIAIFQNITRATVALPRTMLYHVTPLTPVQEHVIALLGLPPDLYLQVEPTRPCRDRDLLDARVVRQPLLDRPARMAKEVVRDDVEITRGVGMVDGLQQAQVADGVARGGGECDFLAVAHAQRPVEPHFLVPAAVFEWSLNAVAGWRPTWRGRERAGITVPSSSTQRVVAPGGGSV